MEKFLGCKVFLTAYVKVKDDWRDKANLLKEYGYGGQVLTGLGKTAYSIQYGQGRHCRPCPLFVQ